MCTRRTFLQLGTLTLLPSLSGLVLAAKNEKSRVALKYQDKPLDDKTCKNCQHFQDNRTLSNNGCRLIPGDSEIDILGYCVGWAKR